MDGKYIEFNNSIMDLIFFYKQIGDFIYGKNMNRFLSDIYGYGNKNIKIEIRNSNR